MKSAEFDRDMKHLEYMREKQILEIQDFIHTELKGQLHAQENSEKLLLMKQKEEELNKDISRKIQIRKLEKNQLQVFRERELLNEFEENQRKLDEKEFEKQRKKYEKNIEEKIKIKEKIEKQDERRRIKEEQRMLSERILREERMKKEEQKRRYEEKVLNH